MNLGNLLLEPKNNRRKSQLEYAGAGRKWQIDNAIRRMVAVAEHVRDCERCRRIYGAAFDARFEALRGNVSRDSDLEYLAWPPHPYNVLWGMYTGFAPLRTLAQRRLKLGHYQLAEVSTKAQERIAEGLKFEV
jgi:hypothetical protein